MRVLFYVEPHPIRDAATYFNDIARKFVPLLSTGPKLDTRLFANRATLEAVKGDLAPHEKRVIRPTAEDEVIFDRHNRPWMSAGVPIWLDLMAGTGPVTEDYLQVLERIWQRFPFDVIVHWGENGAVTQFIKDRAITRIGMELGCTRPPFLDSIIMDPYGTNGASVVPRLSISDLRDIVDGKPMSRHEALLAYSENLEAKPYEQQFEPVPGDLLARTAGAEKLAFMPLQLFDDANLLRFSPYATLRDVVLDAVPKLAAAGYTTILTPHPASKHRPQGALSTTTARAALRQWWDRIVWLDEAADRPLNAQLIAMSELVVTVNSSVGFEALYFDKPVVVLGDAVYKPRDLFPTLDDFLAGRFDHNAYLDGIGWLRRFFLGGYLQSARLRSDVSSFERCVGLIDRLWRQHGDDPVAVAKGFWQVVAPATQTYAESAAFSGQSVAGQQEFSHPDTAKLALPPSAVGGLENIRWLPAARRLVAHAGAADMAQFSAWLNEAMSRPDGLTTIATIGRVLIPEDYLELHDDVRRAGVEPLMHYIRYGLRERRRPSRHLPGVSAEEMEEKLLSAATHALSPDGGLLDRHPLEPLEAERREDETTRIRYGLAPSRRRIAVVAHLYYSDLVPRVLEGIRAIPEAFDLIITLPDWGSRRIEDMVRKAFPEAMFYHAANRGRDIGPFVDLLPILIDKGYDAVLKLQTKRGDYVAGRLHPDLGHLWREETFNALLGSPERIAAILGAFRSHPDLAMIGPEPHYLSFADYPYHDGGALAQAALGDEVGEGFFADSMFWVRPDVLRALVDPLEMSITAFAAETGANDGALLHLVERLFGHAATAAGAVVGAPTDPQAPLSDPLTPLAITARDRIEQALRDRRAQEAVMADRKGALAW